VSRAIELARIAPRTIRPGRSRGRPRTAHDHAGVGASRFVGPVRDRHVMLDGQSSEALESSVVDNGTDPRVRLEDEFNLLKPPWPSRRRGRPANDHQPQAGIRPRIAKRATTKGPGLDRLGVRSEPFSDPWEPRIDDRTDRCDDNTGNPDGGDANPVSRRGSRNPHRGREKRNSKGRVEAQNATASAKSKLVELRADAAQVEVQRRGGRCRRGVGPHERSEVRPD